MEPKKLWQKGDKLTLTLSPPIPEQHFYAPSIGPRKRTVFNGYAERKAAFLKEWDTTFKQWYNTKLVSDYEFYLEISKSGLLHFHGWITVRRPQHLAHTLGLLKYVRNFQGIEVDTIKDMEVWKEYITKDHHQMKTTLTPTTKVEAGVWFYLEDHSTEPETTNNNKSHSGVDRGVAPSSNSLDSI